MVFAFVLFFRTSDSAEMFIELPFFGNMVSPVNNFHKLVLMFLRWSAVHGEVSATLAGLRCNHIMKFIAEAGEECHTKIVLISTGFGAITTCCAWIV